MAATCDPLTRLEQLLLAEGCAAATLAALRRNVEAEVAAAADDSLAGPDPTPQMSAKETIPVELTHPSHEVRGDAENATLTMGQILESVSS